MAAIGRKNVDLYALNAQYADQIQRAELGETKTGQVDLGKVQKTSRLMSEQSVKVVNDPQTALVDGTSTDGFSQKTLNVEDDNSPKAEFPARDVVSSEQFAMDEGNQKFKVD